MNQEYEAVGFAPSVLNKDRVAIATIEEKTVGIGRLVPLKEGVIRRIQNF